MTVYAERSVHLLMVTAAPATWALHFMACYVTAAVWCAKMPTPLAPLGAVRGAVGVLTAVALAVIAAVAWWGYRAHHTAGGTPPHDADVPEDRHRFLGFATLLLAGLSAFAVAATAVVAVFVETCQ